MEHLALYRKYRPKTFSDVYGQEHVTSVLRYESAEGKLSHAYLFCGPRGTGKTTCAKILSKAVNCESPVNGDPCGKCPSCLAIENETASDVVEMDAASNTGVGYIRDIKDEVSFTPALLKKRVYIIDEVHMLSMGAFNALLKTLEEPPAHVMFILATTEQHKLPATIISRCQRFDFRRIPLSVISDRLSYIASRENISLDPDASLLIAKQSAGGMRDAINLMELCSVGGVKIDADTVKDKLGISGLEAMSSVADAVTSSDYHAIFSMIDRTVSSSKDLTVFFGELISFWRDMTVIRYSSSDEPYLDLTASEKETVKSSSEKFTPEELLFHLNLLESAVSEMSRLPQIKRYTAEITLLKMCDKRLSTSPESLLARVSSLEDSVNLISSGVSPRRTEPTGEAASSSVNKKETVKPDKTSDTAKPKKPERPKDESRPDQIRDPGDLIARVSVAYPSVSAILKDSEYYLDISDNKLIIVVKNEFGAKMLDRPDILEMIRNSCVLSGLSSEPAEAVIKVNDKNELSFDLSVFDGIDT